MTSVAVVICTHTLDRFALLTAAVASVKRQTRPATETIVVVDHAPDLEARARAELRDVRVVPNTRARGLSGARNTGVATTDADVVVFLDDDAEADDAWLEHLVAPYADPAVAGVGGAIRPRWETGRPAWFPPEFDWVVGCTYAGMPINGGQVRNMIGANMSLRRDVLEAVGPFQEDMGRIGSTPLGCEETELCLRVRQQLPAMHIVFVPDAVVDHVVPAARGTLRYFRARCWAEGLSKATVTERAGAADGLRSERAYALKALPRAAGRGLAHAITHRDLAAAGRSAAIATGLFATTGGFVAGRIRHERVTHG